MPQSMKDARVQWTDSGEGLSTDSRRPDRTALGRYVARGRFSHAAAFLCEWRYGRAGTTWGRSPALPLGCIPGGTVPNRGGRGFPVTCLPYPNCGLHALAAIRAPLGKPVTCESLTPIEPKLSESLVSIDTTSSGGKLIFHMFGAVAEFERNIIRDRTQAGLAAARARGRKEGRPKALNQEKRFHAVQLYQERKHSIQEICRLMGISKPTLYSYIREKHS